MAQHHFGGKNQRAGVDLVQAGVLRRRTVRGFKSGVLVGDICARGDADATDLRGQCVGDVIPVEIERGDHIVFRRAQQDLLQESVGNCLLYTSVRYFSGS